MALFKFTKNIFEGKSIQVFNHGKHRRDFTYIDDIVEGVIRVLDKPAQADPNWNSDNPNPSTSKAPWRLYNIGNNRPVQLLDFISALEMAIGKPAIKELAPLQAGDVLETYADVTDLVRDFDYQPQTTVNEGILKFVAWYRSFFHQ